MLQESFFQWHIGNVVEIATGVVLVAGYLISRKTEMRERREGQAKAVKDREEALTLQTKMHTENSERLKVLMKFHETQVTLNIKIDAQIAQLTSQTGILAEMSRGMDRRVQMMENRWKGNK